MTQAKNEQRKQTLRDKVNHASTVAAVVATPVIMATGAHAAEGDIDIGTLSLGGLGVAAAAVFAIKAGPSLLMWGYRKILGFVGR
ncbi:hypothetical protein [Acinetobacter baumannii]|uniref:hypothetical protein n=1 Tax=Acinetobacter baumannii TaxID=470 RepID=UPI000E08EC2E|nr:hypothetical protein [Acinetobacter baumannii]ELB2472482.1 hypothetical protein [Acinetobacter baumannii]QFV04149.1 hypothetical protein DLI69_13285 [Acinetobacter baumannii]RDF65407.1 hypothetical protein DV997_19935 [Acinetobacter baumannii]TDI04112.1 hypothetical protein DWA11_17220 [Acinetobacter baumannii]TPR92534.1 hypothetical protein FJV10_18100 [Acinetobacter baumannii]